MTRYWIGVASRDHAKAGEAGGFCQLGHGKEAPVRRLSPGDWIIYYSPREGMGEGEVVQAFVTLGQIKQGGHYRAQQSETFGPFRRDVNYHKVQEAPIRPMLEELGFIENTRSWGMPFRRGSFEISKEDFVVIANAMRIGLAP